MKHYSQVYNQPSFMSARSKNKSDIFFITAIFFSLMFHALFLYVSTEWQVSDARNVEQNVEKMFRVELRQLESTNFVSRPTHQELQMERERILQEDMAEMMELEERSVEDQLASLSPDFNENQIPVFEEDLEDDLFLDDQPARQLIQSDVSQRNVDMFENTLGKESVSDQVEQKRVTLSGRGAGSGNRILSDLPEPEYDAEPTTSTTLSMVVRSDLAPPAPEMDVSEPPIELPPVREILPSPELLDDTGEAAELQREKEEREEIKRRYIQLDDIVDVRLYTYHDEDGQGYFKIRIRPFQTDERLKVLPKDVVFVLDASRSMGNWRLNTIKDEIEELLQQLRPEDRFNIFGFKESIKRYTRTLVDATETNVEKATYFLKRLESSGRTDLYSSLQPIVQLGTERARPLIMLLFSDGRPTVGVKNSRNIINDLTRFRGESSSIFCIGTGSKLNRYLLDMLAYRNRGLVAFERDRSKLPGVIQSVYGYIEDPVLLKVKADFDQVDQEEVYPKILPDLFLRGELKIWGLLDEEETITLRLLGEAYDEQKEIIVELAVPSEDNGTVEIARDWAFHKIYYLVGQMVQHGEQPHLFRQIEELSEKYDVITPYTNPS